MVTTPISPGRLYRVRGFGLDLTVVASHPCDALQVLLSIVEGAR